ncbi:hypothetical protein Rhe02_66090 [Rhizocola hellebori]|uniref:Lipoprotein n=1 Tax=Rhizocola hellebori TaxID=1392758 RepID=A0A8J3QFB0_9ACTN|nr:hypothetical protein [Rhizocola hellebori]GIH08542.1 hypothetical protein Rhe02_66090 [Rhizocola hellebori]
MALGRTVVLGAAMMATFSACGSQEPPSDRLANVAWLPFLAHCPIGEAHGFGMKIDSVVKGELTGDQVPDTLVIDSCDSPTGSNPQTVEVFDGASDPAAPARLGILMAQDPDYPRKMQVTVRPDRTVVVKALGLQPESPRCCPDLEIVAEFAWRDGTFVTLTRQTRPV